MNISRLFVIMSIVLVVASAAIGVNAQDVEPDRISFYNVPSDEKYILHIDYADGTEAREPQGACEPGRVIEEQLNTYQATFITEGCTDDVHQHLNVRWLGGCAFNFEDDPDARIVTRGDYGSVTVTGHYPQGSATLPVPAGTISMSVVMSYTIDGILTTGNVGFDFDTTQGCVDAPETPTATQTPAMVDTATQTPTGTQTPTATPTDETVIDCCLSTPVTFTPTPAATDTVTPTPTEAVSGQNPTGEQPVAEPGRMVFLPMVSR